MILVKLSPVLLFHIIIGTGFQRLLVITMQAFNFHLFTVHNLHICNGVFIKVNRTKSENKNPEASEMPHDLTDCFCVLHPSGAQH